MWDPHSKLVQTTEPTIFISKNHKKYCAVYRTSQIQWVKRRKEWKALPESHQKYNPDYKDSPILKELKMSPARVVAGGCCDATARECLLQ